MSLNQRLKFMSRTWKWALVAGLAAATVHPEAAQAVEKNKKLQVRRAKKSKKSNAQILQTLSVAEKPSGELHLELGLSAPGNFNAYRTHGPERLVVDLVGVRPGKIARRKDLGAWVSSGVLVYPVQVAGFDATRVEVELRRGVRYEVEGDKRSIRVLLTPEEPAPKRRGSDSNEQDRKAQAQLQQKLTQAKQKVAATQAQLKALVHKAKELNTAKDASKEQLAAMDRAVALQKAALVRQKNKAKHLQASLAASQRELARTRDEVRSMKLAQARTQADMAKLDRQLKDKEAAAQQTIQQADRYLEEAKRTRLESLELRAAAQEQLSQAKKAGIQARAQRKGAKANAELRKNNRALAQDKGRLQSLLAKETQARRSLEKSMKRRTQRIATLERRIERAKTKIANTDEVGLRRALAVAKAEQQSLELAGSALRMEVRRLGKAQSQTKQDKKTIKEQRALLLERKAQLEQTQERLARSKKEQRQFRKALAKGKGQSKALARSNRAAKQRLAKAQAQLAAMHQKTDKQTESLRAVQGQLRKAQVKLHRTLEQLAIQTERNEQLAQATTRKSAPAKKQLISGLQLIDEGDAMRIVLRGQGPVEVAKRSVSPTMQLLELKNAKLAPELERSFDARAYKGPIAKITSFNDDSRVSIMVTAAMGASSKVVRQGDQISWVFPRSGAQKAQVDEPSLETMHSAPVAMASASTMRTPSGPKRRKKWHGERIDIELQDAPIKDVLLLFSDIGRVNIIAGKGVQGQVSLKLNSVPWDQALDIILRSLGLGLIKEGNVIRVATTADLEAERARAIEQASAQVQLKPLETRLVPLSYATVDEMVPKVQSVLSSRGTVTPDTRTNVLIIMDVAENISLAEQLVSQLDGQTPQVLIEARIVEARTQWLRQLGIQWGFDAIASPGTGNPTGLLFPSSVGIAGGSGGSQADRRGIILSGSQQNPNYAVDLPAPVGSGNGGAIGMSFGSLAGNLNTNLRLSAAEEGGEVRLISAPKVVTMDNTKASIEQGVQIPISQVSQNGVNTRYVNATLGLQVTPHVTNEGSIVLEVQVQKNEADFVNTGARGDPTILTKQAKSRMLIQDGDTAVIGGIYTRNQSTNRKKVPWIADVPILGWFFKNRSEADTRTELLIFLTPKIINRSTSIGG